MPATWLDIVDTVVKIGLGAVISGFATLSVTKYKFRSDKELASAQRRRESLDQVAEHTEEFSHICLNYWARILDWTRKKSAGRVINEMVESELKRVRGELFSSYKLLAIAESKLLLLGENNAQVLLREYGEELTKFYATVFIGEHGVPVEDIEKWRTIILEKRALVFNELAKLYQAT